MPACLVVRWFARIFPLCVPPLSQSAQNQLVELVVCYVSTSAANHGSADKPDRIDHTALQCHPLMYDVSSLQVDQPQTASMDRVECGQPSNAGRWTICNGEWIWNILLSSGIAGWRRGHPDHVQLPKGIHMKRKNMVNFFLHSCGRGG